MVPAILTNDKVVTGLHHGDAFSKLDEKEKNGELISGFIDQENNKFISENQVIYLKEIILLRHAEYDNQQDGSITTEGRSHALKLANFISSLHLSGFIGFSSPYKRCQQTSAILESICQLSFTITPALSDGSGCDILDSLPKKSVLVTHMDFIQNILSLTHLIKGRIEFIGNCSITYINQNRLIWLAREIINDQEYNYRPAY